MCIMLFLANAEDVCLLGYEDGLCDSTASMVERVAVATPALAREVGCCVHSLHILCIHDVVNMVGIVKYTGIIGLLMLHKCSIPFLSVTILLDKGNGPMLNGQ